MSPKLFKHDVRACLVLSMLVASGQAAAILGSGRSQLTTLRASATGAVAGRVTGRGDTLRLRGGFFGAKKETV
jgi:hypothetical protein